MLNRLGLAFSPHDQFTVGILRSNSQDNLELNARIAGLGLDAATGPLEFAAQAGVAWNLQVEAGDDHGGHQHATLHDANARIGSNGNDTAGENEVQAYAQVIANTTPGRSALKSALAGTSSNSWSPTSTR